MLVNLAIAFTLMAVCVVVHAAGVTSALRWVRPRAEAAREFRGRVWLFVRIVGWIVLLHLLEIAVWGAFYVVSGAIPDVQDSLYFSAVTYTTTGYGDLVLPEAWRLIGGVEALTGILLCGWSTGFFFAVVRGLERAVEQPRPSIRRT